MSWSNELRLKLNDTLIVSGSRVDVKTDFQWSKCPFNGHPGAEQQGVFIEALTRVDDGGDESPSGRHI